MALGTSAASASPAVPRPVCSSPPLHRHGVMETCIFFSQVFGCWGCLFYWQVTRRFSALAHALANSDVDAQQDRHFLMEGCDHLVNFVVLHVHDAQLPMDQASCFQLFIRSYGCRLVVLRLWIIGAAGRLDWAPRRTPGEPNARRL